TNLGRNSLAGAVVLAPQSPTAVRDLRLRAGALSREGHDLALAAGGPVGDSWRFRMSGQDRYDRGDIQNITRDEDDAGREDTRFGRLQAEWLPNWGNGYRLRLASTVAEAEYGDPLHDSSQGERTETSDHRANGDNLSRLHSLRQELDLNPRWRLESISGWTDSDVLYTIDFDRSAEEGGYSDNIAKEGIGSQELRLQTRQNQWRAVFGAYYADRDRRTGTVGYDVAAGGGAALLNGVVDATTEQRTLALFAEADWDFAEDFRLTAGLRWNHEDGEYTGYSELDLTLTAPLDFVLGQVPGAPAPPEALSDLPLQVPLPDAASDLLAVLLPTFVPPDYDEADSSRHVDWLPKLGLSWFVGPDTTLGLSYQEGYRSGGVSISFFGGSLSRFDPETTRTTELSLRQVLLQGQLLLNANLFYTDWRDQQVAIGETSGFSTVTENAGRSHFYGLESELLWRPAGPVEVFTSIGLLRSEFDEFVNEEEDYKNNRFPYAAEQTGSLGLRLVDWKGLRGEIALQHIGAFYSDADNDPDSEAPARTLLNAKLGYAFAGGWSISVFGRNLTDDPNRQGALVTSSGLGSRYGEAFTLGANLELDL
ncbi:MAG: TonB-dependent receptor, partial [Oceanococcaceae bacterium]